MALNQYHKCLDSTSNIFLNNNVSRDHNKKHLILFFQLFVMYLLRKCKVQPPHNHHNYILHQQLNYYQRPIVHLLWGLLWLSCIYIHFFCILLCLFDRYIYNLLPYNRRQKSLDIKAKEF